MKWFSTFMSFWYHFIVGDDWRLAVGVVVGLSLVVALGSAVWVLPTVVTIALSWSLLRNSR
jgi:hypothetical protein